MHRILAVFVTIVICLSLTACAGDNNINLNAQTMEATGNILKSDEIADKGPVKGGVVKLFSTKPDTLNPILTNNVYVQDFSSLIFESMVKLGRDQSVIPVLCDKWDVSPDGLIWTFHIRENVFWHNNTKFTADDIKYTFDAIENNNLKSIYKKNLENVAAYAAMDSSHFKVILKKSDSFTAEQFTFPIICQNYFQGEDLAILNSVKNMAPIGTGPFKYSSYNGSNNLSLVSNENWWSKKRNADNKLELPYISGVDIKIFQNGSDAVTAFQTQDIDAAVLPISDFSKYNGRSDLVVRKYISKNYELLSFNLQNPILGDKSVRQAISYAIDKVGLINEVIPGQAVASDLPIIPDSWLNSTNILSYIQDKEKAVSILISGGWKQEITGDKISFYKNIKGVRTELKFEILVNDFDDIRYKVADYICNELNELGFEAKVTKLSWDAETKAINTRKFDAAIMGYKINSVPDISFALSSGDILSGLNISGYNNPAVDSILNQIRTENDVNRKKILMSDLKVITNDEVPFVGLYFYNNAVIFSKKIRGELNPIVWDKFNDITKWYIPVKN